MFAINKEIRENIEKTLEDARERGGENWAYQQMMHKLAAHEATRKRNQSEAAKGQSFLEDNKVHTIRHRPDTRALIMHSKTQRERQHAGMVVAARNERQSETLLKRNTHTSLHRSVASERNRALRRWVLDTAAHNHASFLLRWVGATVLASKTHALMRNLARKRQSSNALNTLFSVALVSAKFCTMVKRRRKQVNADRLADFLSQMMVNGKWNKWILCFGRARRCVVRCQRIWRGKQQCRIAHRTALLQQFSNHLRLRRRHEEGLPEDSSRRGSNNNFASSGSFAVEVSVEEKNKAEEKEEEAAAAAVVTALAPAAVLVAERFLLKWQRSKVHDVAVALQLWEKFELTPLLRKTLKEKPGLVLLDLTLPSSWPPRGIVKVNPLTEYVAKALQKKALKAEETRKRAANERKKRRLLKIKEHGGSSPSPADNDDEDEDDEEDDSEAATKANTREQSKRAKRRWRFARWCLFASRAFQSRGQYARPGGRGQLSEACEALCGELKRACRVGAFLEKHGDLARVKPKPKLAFLMTERELERLRVDVEVEEAEIVRTEK